MVSRGAGGSEGVNPYNPKATCQKCGSREVTTSYCRGFDSRCIARDRGKPYSSCDFEHLVRHCHRCGFRWPELCRDDPQAAIARLAVPAEAAA